MQAKSLQLCPTVSRPYGLFLPPRLLCPSNYPGKNLEWVAVPSSGTLPNPAVEPTALCPLHRQVCSLPLAAPELTSVSSRPLFHLIQDLRFVNASYERKREKEPWPHVNLAKSNAVAGKTVNLGHRHCLVEDATLFSLGSRTAGFAFWLPAVPLRRNTSRQNEYVLYKNIWKPVKLYSALLMCFVNVNQEEANPWLCDV